MAPDGRFATDELTCGELTVTWSQDDGADDTVLVEVRGTGGLELVSHEAPYKVEIERLELD